MSSEESHFNVSLIVRDKVTRQCPQTTTFEEKGEPKRKSSRSPSAYQPNALPPGQTGSRCCRKDGYTIYCEEGTRGHFENGVVAMVIWGLSLIGVSVKAKASSWSLWGSVETW